MYFSGAKVCVSLKGVNMVINKSVVKWNDMEVLPKDLHPVLLLWLDEMYDEVNVSSGMYSEYDKNFIDSDAFDFPSIRNNVLAWAEYPTVGVLVNRQGKNQAYVSQSM